MPLAEHFREFRGRLLRSIVVLLVATVLTWYFYDQIFAFLLRPYDEARKALAGRIATKATINGSTTAFMLQLKLSVAAAVVLTSPYWLYQTWAFILPGLHPHERRASRLFMAVAGPLFVAGVAVGYYVLPRGLQVLLGFTPGNVQSFVPVDTYLSFVIRMVLVFGISFEIPLFVLLLNLAGVVSGKKLGEYRAWVIVIVFVFAAAATPSTDPFSMCMLAIPMTLLFIASEVIARLVDRRRARADARSALDDDEASPL